MPCPTRTRLRSAFMIYCVDEQRQNPAWAAGLPPGIAAEQRAERWMALSAEERGHYEAREALERDSSTLALAYRNALRLQTLATAAAAATSLS